MSGADRPVDLVDTGPFAPRLATRWLATEPERRHRHLSGTLVSADLSGFTALSERLAERGKEGAERLTALINGCFTSLIDAAAREGGDVLKFGGDALLLWFEGEGHAHRGATAAARMQRAIGSARFARAGLRMSAGAHTGDVDAYLLGQPDWRELVVLGATVSTTVKLEGAASAGEVQVSEELAGDLAPAWTTPTEGGLALDLKAIPLPRRPVPPVEAGGAHAGLLLAPHIRAGLAAIESIGGEHRLATTVFVSVEGTDTLAAELGAGFGERLDGLIRAAQAAADRLGVHLLGTDVLDDELKLICTAGAPASTGDDDEAALRFATELVHGDPLGRIRAGVNRGRVFAGFLGSPRRRTFTVMGDAVNLAARLMGKAEPGQVVAGRDVTVHARTVFATEALPPFRVKGKSEPIDALVVGPATDQRRERTMAVLPLVGRDGELDRLRAAAALAASGTGQVVEIVAEAGMGKSRLIAALAEEPLFAARHFFTECQPYDALSPYSSTRALLRPALGLDDHRSPAALRRSLEETASRVAPEVAALLPLLEPALAIALAPTPESAAVADEFRAARMHEVAVALLTGLLGAPTLLVVEDVHCIDDSSRRLLAAVMAAVPERPWLLVVTRRPEGEALRDEATPGFVLELEPLAAEAVAVLVEAAGAGTDAAREVVAPVAERAGGNPLFVLQLVEAASRGVAASELPESIERLVAGRVDRLAPDDRALLRQAAVMGRVFHTALVNSVRAAAGEPLAAREQWERLGDLVEPVEGRTWRFRHALYRDAAYEGLPFARRKRMHAAVGELLEAGVAGEPEPALLSQHFWLAGDAERTWRYSVAAGDAAWAAFATTEAIAAYQRALDQRRRLRRLDRAEISQVAETLGDVLERAARYDEAHQAYGMARKQAGSCPHPTSSARLARKVGVVLARQAAFGRAKSHFDRALRASAARSSRDLTREYAWAELEQGALRYRQGRFRDTESWARRALATGGSIADDLVVAYASNLLQVALNNGTISCDTSHGERALEIFRQLGDVHNEGKALNNLGVHAYFRGDWRTATARYEAAEVAFLRSGDVAEAAIAANNLGEILSDQGHYDLAAERFESALETWQRARYPLGIGLALSNLGRLASRQGDVTRAIEQLDASLALFDGITSTSLGIEARVRRAEALLLGGDPEGALRWADDVLDRHQHDAEAHATTVATALRVRGAALLDTDEEQALDALHRAHQLSERSSSLFDLALTSDALGQILSARDPVRAQALRDQASQVLVKLGVVRVPQVR